MSDLLKNELGMDALTWVIGVLLMIGLPVALALWFG